MRHLAVAAAALLCLLATSSANALSTFSGVDAGVEPSDPRPNSDSAAAAFDAAATGVIGLITFENLGAQTYTGPIEVATGVTLIITTNEFGGTGIVNFENRYLGFNTTTGGELWVR